MRPETERRHSIDIFLEGDAIKADSFIDLIGNGVLQQNAVNRRVSVQGINFREQLRCGGGRREGDSSRIHPHAATRVALHFYIRCGGGIFTHEDRREDRTRSATRLDHPRDASGELRLGRLGERLSVEHQRFSHSSILRRPRRGARDPSTPDADSIRGSRGEPEPTASRPAWLRSSGRPIRTSRRATHGCARAHRRPRWATPGIGGVLPVARG